MRPNIRVEIQNNLVEEMEVDENEEGEISDHEEKETPEKNNILFMANEKGDSRNQITKPIFFTGVNVFDKKEQEKLEERAKRFSLNPEETNNFRDVDLQLLYSSLGITPTNESNVRFEVIHMRGIDQMNAGDILDYFLEFAPVSVEWIDEESCNVVWSDRMSATRALHFMSKPVRGMPVRDDACYFDTNLQETEEIDQSILLVNKNRQVELQEDKEESKIFNETNSVDISEITTTIPPGYWRLGNKYPKAKCTLLRFSLKTDKKHFKIEQLSRYYKSQGKKNFKVTVTQSGKQQITHGIFGRNKDMRRFTNEENPWTLLAKNWDEDAPFREKERTKDPVEAEPQINVKNHSLRIRLGSKRKESEEEAAEEEEEPTEKPPPKKKIKIPRMRMYADEEEEKIKRKQMLKKIDRQIKRIDDDPSSNSDLRTVLNMTNRTNAVKLDKPEPEVFDLGSKLKNRNKKMVFEIKSEVERGREKIRHHSKPYMDREIDRQRRRRKYSNSDDEDFTYRRSGDKPQSKVAVVIKTQKKPAVASAVASTVWSRVSAKPNNAESESESNSESSDSEHSSESEKDDATSDRKFSSRPGFTRSISSSSGTYKSPLKIEISNDHFKRN